MRITTQRVRAHTIIRYQCRVCRKKHTTENAARYCEARPVENKAFILGQVVRVIERRECSGRPYFAKGVVTSITGPTLPDRDYEIRWLGAKPERLNGHIFMYEIKFFCPRCKRPKKVVAFTPELRPARY